MEARRGQSSPATAAAMGLLLFASSFWSQAAAAVGAATELQKHVAFFDSDHDSIISFSETYEGFRALGFGVVTSKLSATLINGALGPETRPENATASRFSIYIENIHRGVHGSDSGAYDSEGRFVHEKFDEIFTKHAKTVPDGLTSAELEEMLRANRKPKDYKGWLGASTEWETTFKLAKDKDGFLRKDTVRAAMMVASSVNWRRRRRSLCKPSMMGFGKEKCTKLIKHVNGSLIMNVPYLPMKCSKVTCICLGAET